MRSSSSGISGSRVLAEAFSALLVAGFQARLVDLPVRAQAEIAEDSNGSGGCKTGYIGYAQAALVTGFGNARFALACGTKCGHYPGDFYRTDIAAAPLRGFGVDELPSPAHLGGALTGNEYFRHSLVVACKDGSIRCLQEGTFALRASAMITPSLAGFRVMDAVSDPTCIDPDTMRPRTARGVTYQPDMIAFLASAIHTILMHPIGSGVSVSVLISMLKS